MLKRVTDIAIASLAILLLSPLAAVVASAIVFCDGPPVFFCHRRVGKGGQDFQLFKFRTMRNKPAAENGSFDCGNSSRVTRLGRLLRLTKLDELPQLINVIKGDMSLVGPRPEVRKWVEECPEQWRKIHKVRPGITDPASIMYRYEEQMLAESEEPESLYRDVILPKKLASYEKYIDGKESIARDLMILASTLLAIFTTNKKVGM